MEKFEQMGQISEEKQPEEGLAKKAIEKTREFIQGKVSESNMPTKEKLGYESTVGFYGGKLRRDNGGKMVYDSRGLISTIDRVGDAVLRTYDEHIMKNPIEVLKRHPKWFFRFLMPGSKRYRGKTEEIIENVKRLGLEDIYGEHEWGIEVKKEDVFTGGRALQDIYRSNLIESDDLGGVDRFSALEKASRYVNDVHGNYGAIGELLPSDIIFQEKDETGISKPVLNIPDIVFNKEKKIGELEKRAIDIFDFTFSIAIEELQRSQDWNEVKNAIEIIIGSYENKEVIDMLKSLIKRGRLTMQGNEDITDFSKFASSIVPLTEQHNKARLGLNDKDIVNSLRDLMVSVCEESMDGRE